MRTFQAFFAVVMAACLIGCSATPSASPDDANNDLDHTILAVVRPGGATVFAVRPYEERAVQKAKVIAKRVASEAGKEYVAFEPEVYLFDSSEELYKIVALPEGVQIQGQFTLAKKRHCVQVRSDSACRGSDKNWYKDHYTATNDCRPGGNDECWSSFGTVGHTYHYKSKADCENGATPTGSTGLSGNYCD